MVNDDLQQPGNSAVILRNTEGMGRLRQPSLYLRGGFSSERGVPEDEHSYMPEHVAFQNSVAKASPVSLPRTFANHHGNRTYIPAAVAYDRAL